MNATAPRVLPPAERRGLFGALAEPRFRWFWGGLLSYTIANDMMRFLMPWLAYEVSGSTLVLGLVGLSLALPNILLAPIGGVWADRLDRAQVMRLTQSAIALVAIALALLLIGGIFQLWQLVVASMLIGTVHAFDQPVRQAIVPSLVPPAALTSAVALTSAAWNLARILGPAISGVLLALVLPTGAGPGPLFLVAAAGFGAMMFAASRLRGGPRPSSAARRHWGSEFLEGARFIAHHRVVRALILLVFAGSFFGSAYVILMPAIAKEVYATDPRGLGLLLSSVGIGALFGTLVLAVVGGERRRGAWMLVGAVTFGALLVAFSFSRSFLVAVPLLVVTGAVHSWYMTHAQTLLQVLVPNAVRGRVMGIYALNFTLIPLGAAWSGAVASLWGTPVAVLAGGVILIALTLAVALAVPELRGAD